MYSRTQSYMLEAIFPKEIPNENPRSDSLPRLRWLRHHAALPGRRNQALPQASPDVRNRVRSRCEAQVPLGDTYANGCQLRNRVPKFLFNSSMGCGWLVDDIDVQPMSRREADTREPAPRIIVVGAGLPKRSAVEILMHPLPMPQWLPLTRNERLRGQDEEPDACG